VTTNLRVLTWNVLGRDRQARLDALCDTIRRINPDIVMLQESSSEHAQHVGARTGLQLIAVPDVPSAPSTSVPTLLARNPLQDGASIELSAPIDGHYYYAVTATFEHEKVLSQFCSTHLRHTDRAGRMGLDAGYRKAGRAGGADSTLVQNLAPNLRHSVAARLSQIDVLHENLVGISSQTARNTRPSSARGGRTHGAQPHALALDPRSLIVTPSSPTVVPPIKTSKWKPNQAGRPTWITPSTSNSTKDN